MSREVLKVRRLVDDPRWERAGWAGAADVDVLTARGDAMRLCPRRKLERSCGRTHGAHQPVWPSRC